MPALAYAEQVHQDVLMGARGQMEHPLLRRSSWPLLLLLTVFSLLRAYHDLRPTLVPVRGHRLFYDFQVMVKNLRAYEGTGELYDTSDPHCFDPTTTSMFKYPPPHAALLLAIIDLDARTDLPPRQRLHHQMRPMVILCVTALAASLALALLLLHAGAKRTFLMAAVFLNWQPTWDYLSGPQIEPVLLLLVPAAYQNELIPTGQFPGRGLIKPLTLRAQ